MGAAVAANDLMRLIDLDQGRAHAAAIDGPWQALTLAGVREESPMACDSLIHEAPTYDGMLFAVWAP